MQKIDLSYSLSDKPAGIGPIRNALMDQLQAVREQRSLSAAAKALGCSYRHLWGELKRWEQRLGRALIVWERGQAAHLSEFADKLLWAERQAQARLAPQIEALRGDIEHALAVAFDDSALVLQMHASHDDALVLLRGYAAAHARLLLDIGFSGSLDALRALREGRCQIAGFHLCDGPAIAGKGTRDGYAAYAHWLRADADQLITFTQRTQGLMVAAGNPLGLSAISDLARADLRFVNRAPGSGTRVLLDALLAQAGIPPEQVKGYARWEPSHAAVAQAVASGSADAGLGLESAARAARLGFVALRVETYYLACSVEVLATPAMQTLVRLLASPAWRERVIALPGYGALDSGALTPARALPWLHQTAQVRKPTKASSRSGKA